MAYTCLPCDFYQNMMHASIVKHSEGCMLPFCRAKRNMMCIASAAMKQAPGIHAHWRFGETSSIGSGRMHICCRQGQIKPAALGACKPLKPPVFALVMKVQVTRFHVGMVLC